MISHRVVVRHAKLFQSRFGDLLDRWSQDIDAQRKLIEHRIRPGDAAEPQAVRCLEQEEALRNRIEETLSGIFALETWIE